MVEIKYADVMNVRFPEALSLLIEKDLDLAFSKELADSIDPINAAVSEAKKVKDALIKEFGNEVKDGDKVVGWTLDGVSEEKIKGFEEKFLAAMDTKVELPLSGKIGLDRSDKMKPIHLFLLEKLVEVKG